MCEKIQKMKIGRLNIFGINELVNFRIGLFIPDKEALMISQSLYKLIKDNNNVIFDGLQVRSMPKNKYKSVLEWITSLKKDDSVYVKTKFN